MTNAAEAFGILAGLGAKQDQFTSRASDLELNGAPVRHAIDFKGLPSLLVPLADAELDLFDDESKGINISTHVFPLGEDTGRFLVIRCLDARLQSQFFVLIDDMFQALESENVPAAVTCLGILTRWRELFEHNDSALLTQNAQVGLLAELHVLEELARSAPVTALSRWQGPESGRHDFATKRHSLEVKGTTSRDTFTVGIHGAMQLEKPEESELWLYAEQMEASPDGDSVAAAVERILQLVTDRYEFLRKLRLAGYRVDDSDAYKLYTFSLLRRKVCHVDISFPRIVREAFIDQGVLDRITRLEYSIDIGPIQPSAPDGNALTAAAGLLA